MAIYIALLLLSYLIGSVSGSLLLGRLRGIDIRTQGSGNAGGTNAFRTQGVKFALGVVLIDIGKGVLAVWLVQRFVSQPEWAGWAALLAAAAGHVWPIFHGFRGGKGAATLVGGLVIAWPWTLVPLLAVWLLSLTITGYVGLSTILAGITLAICALSDMADVPRLAACVAAALFLVYTHRSNLLRMRAGSEPRFERARVLARLFGHKPA